MYARIQSFIIPRNPCRGVLEIFFVEFGDSSTAARLSTRGMRRLADGDIYKPYAIINDHTFAAAESELKK